MIWLLALSIRKNTPMAITNTGKVCKPSAQQHVYGVSCRHVILPKELAKSVARGRVLAESEWRGIGVQQSRGWEHYAIHK